MLKLAPWLLLFFSLTAYSTAYTIGKLRDWQPMINAATSYLETEASGKVDELTPEVREKAVYVFGFFQGLQNGVLIKSLIQIEGDYGDTRMNNEDYAKYDAGYCLEESYWEAIGRFDKHLNEKQYDPDYEFLGVLMEFLNTEYPCDET